jgi:16S rRNA (guanine966-N2)-methyltransferase
MAGPLDGMKVLDLYAGSGALGIEALSRGAVHCLFVDSSRASCGLISKNLESTGFLSSAKVWCKPTARAIADLTAAEAAHDLILIDPPYGSADLPATLQAVSSGAAVGRTAIVVVETSSSDGMTAEYDNLALCDRRTYGSTSLLFFRYHRHD